MGQGGGPGDGVGLVLEVAGHVERQVVPQVAAPRQAQRVVQQLRAAQHGQLPTLVALVLLQVLGQRLPVAVVVVDAVEAYTNTKMT